MDWVLFGTLLLYLSTQSALDNMFHSHKPKYFGFLPVMQMADGFP